MFKRLVSNSKVLVTTPIFYINGAPHIGHLYSIVLCEYLKRVHKMNGNQTYMSTGTDEHGEKVLKAAISRELDILTHTEQNSQVFKDLLIRCEVDHDQFIRTTEADHKVVVNKLWETLQAKGYIKKEKYRGWYSLREETFYNERDLLKDTFGRMVTVEGDLVEQIEEENYMLKMKGYLPDAASFIRESAIYPSGHKSKLTNLLDVRDVSISRLKSKLNWGVHLDSDPSCVVYVWFDALINYITVARRLKLLNEGTLEVNEPFTMVNVVGKDIIKFHGIMFPIINRMSGMGFAHQIVCHEHWLKDGRKMSKSLANVLDPDYYLAKYSPEQVKLYLIVAGPYNQDTDFSETLLVNLYNAFVDKVVNCYFRVFATSFLKDTDLSQALNGDVELSETDQPDWMELGTLYRQIVDGVGLEAAPEATWNAIILYFDTVNNWMSKAQPWKMKDRHYKSLYVLRLLASLLHVVELLYLFVPSFHRDLRPGLGLMHQCADLELFFQRNKGSFPAVVQHVILNKECFRRHKLCSPED